MKGHRRRVGLGPPSRGRLLRVGSHCIWRRLEWEAQRPHPSCPSEKPCLAHQRPKSGKDEIHARSPTMAESPGTRPANAITKNTNIRRAVFARLSAYNGDREERRLLASGSGALHLGRAFWVAVRPQPLNKCTLQCNGEKVVEHLR
uniref:Uncharacterized protein n=1 Tax=Trypanosoma congolense (strain IL3000) TaxID=1068625 RepID=G0V241_TRYCI|nr:hypothetical protein, unlikely [Trypanosoma congolense IL3000]